MRARAITLALLSLVACESSESPPAPARTTQSASEPATPAAPPVPPAAAAPKHTLATRGDMKLDAIREARPKLLAGLTKARTLLAQRKPDDALVALEELAELDPSGSVLSIEALRAAGAADKSERRQHWALAAAWLSQADDALLARARAAFGKDGAELPAPAGTKLPDQKDARAACDAIVREVSAGRVVVPLLRSRPSEVRCETDYELSLEGAELTRALSFRVQAKADGELRLGWVGLETPKGVVMHGPVATAWSPSSTGATNDFVVDLQQIDVLPGGSPEVIVRVNELATLPDVARNEVAEIDQSRILFLSLDRGRPAVSKQLLLSRRSQVRAIDPKDRRLPLGWARSKLLGQARAFELKVEWGGPNEIRLSKAAGDMTPPEQGTISLFP
jgi:hypothetical protein